MHRSRYPDPVVPEVSLPAYVLSHSADFGSRPALVDGVTGATLTYRELPGVVGSAAAHLRALGAGPGVAVVVSAANQPAWAVALYAVLTTGAVAVPLNPALTAREVGHLVRLSGARLAVTDDDAHPTAREALGDGPLASVLLSELVGARVGGQRPGGNGGGAPGIHADQDPQATAVLAFSSGTTGLPKGVELSHRNLVAVLAQHEGIYHLGADDVVVAALPLFHIYGLSMVLGYALRHGATVVTMPRYRLDRYLALIAEHGATWLHLAPPVALQLLSEEARSADLRSVRHAVSGAAPLDPVVSSRLEERLGCLVGQGYGMTEASPGVTWVPDDGSVACPAGSVGVLVAGTEARVVDPANGADTDGHGELWIRGPQVMRGYRNAPAETADTVVEGGWLRTGDIVRVDEQGVWWVVDRLKELIKYKGYQVAPAELEGVLLEHPAVADAAVAGVPDPAAGEVPAAWVVTRAAVTEEELLAWVAGRVAPYKRVRQLRFVDAVPRSPSGKILRRRLVAAQGPAAAGA